MASPATLKIDIIADVAKAAAGLDQIDKKLGGFGKAVKGAALVGGALAATAGIVKLGGAMLEAGEAGREVTEATRAIIETTGGAANVTTEQLIGTADALARMTGVSDDSIQSAQNMLLTFTELSNEVDDGTGAFDRATKAALDLAAAGFGDVESNAVQLGKALQDPAKGMSALAKSGVSFTEQQQDQIKAMQETGDMLGAQQMILAAVEGQVQGTAEASATSSAKMGIVWEQAMETIGTALLPIVDKLLPVFVDLIDGLIPVVIPVVELIADLATELIDALLPALEPLIPVIADLATMIAGHLGAVIQELAPHLPVLTQAIADIMAAAIPLIPPLLEISLAFLPLLPLISDLIVLASELAVMVLPLLIEPINLIATIIGELSAALETAVGWLQTLIGWVSDALGGIADLISKIGNIPGAGIIGGIIGGFSTGPPGAAGVSTFGTPSSRATSGVRKVQVDVTGVGFDSVLTGRAIARQIRSWETRNGLSPVQWAHQNGGLPA